VEEDEDVTGLLAQWKQEMASGQDHIEDVALLDEWRRDAADTTDRTHAEVREVFGDRALARPSRARRPHGGEGRRLDPSQRRLMRRAVFFIDVRDRIPVAVLDDEQVRRVAEHWAELVDGDLDRARSWWAAGINPLDQSVAELIEARVQPEDLAVQVDGRTLLEHFRSGERDKSGRWCAHEASRARILGRVSERASLSAG
jgi:hypothetical protein